ncbi:MULTISPECIES: GNAT family N-acetyltransferase [Paraburkholderia]|uniref:GNAT family N-acetyltransferase n=1 Tax=Paraburkholderia madseniana TaxID=2599607 RepID=A0AAP5BJ43_9BURK|nr:MULTISPECIES: GNAT family N-acetyltransferase [Paraburkholderia]MCX4149928.1 GNAT family N-acetyltransferase [Paraburkholderia madseniana]MDN7152864.1 GNAT family N-acetyltransferase [Paraburkholderia sp. WS6]MDQ6411746.1 GNAT family N-acetyltransferase [Paraburkholderia madseniana]
MGQAKQRGARDQRMAQAKQRVNDAPRMTDPTDTLKAFQNALRDGLFTPERCELDRELFVHLDHPNGKPRFTYVRLEGETVTSLGVFVVVEPIEGVACFHLGYAVPPVYRGHGFASDLVLAAIGEMRHGFGRAGVKNFCIEAVVGADNAASQRVAEKIGFGEPKEITDQVRGKPALQYVLQVNT